VKHLLKLKLTLRLRSVYQFKCFVYKVQEIENPIWENLESKTLNALVITLNPKP